MIKSNISCPSYKFEIDRERERGKNLGVKPPLGEGKWSILAKK